MSMQLVGDHTSGGSDTDSDSTFSVLAHACAYNPPFPGLPQDSINHRVPERGFASMLGLSHLPISFLFPGFLFALHFPSAFSS